MSSNIERFGRFGQYVLHSEYERVVASLAARAMEQIDSINAVHEAEVARLRAEVEAYKSLVCGIVYNRHKCFIPTDDPNSPTFNWDDRADAAMGASA
jgi:hypothetical protein